MILTWCVFFILVAGCKASYEDLLVPGVPFADIGMGFDYDNKRLGATILKKDTIVKKKPITYASTQYRLVTDFKDVSDLLDVGGSLSLDLTMGVGDLSVSGAGNYVNENADRRDFAELLFTSKIRNNEYRAVSPGSQGRTECHTMTKKQRGTHVITGMTTGGDCIISVKFWVTSSTTKQKIEAEASLGLELGTISVEAEAKFQKLDDKYRDKANVTVTTYCSALFDTVPTNAVTAMRLVKSFLELHKQQNPSGVVKFLHLTPISRISSCGVNQVETSGRSNSRTAYEQQVVSKLMDVKVAYKTLTTCIDLYPLPEKNTKTALIQDVKTLLTTLRSLLITFANITEHIDQYQPSISSFHKLEADYKSNVPSKIGAIENQLWRNRATIQCARLAEAYTDYHPNVVPPTERTLPGSTYNSQWYHLYKGRIHSSSSRTPFEGTECENIGDVPLFFNAQSEMQRATALEKLWIRSSSNSADNGLIGLHVYVTKPGATNSKNLEEMKLIYSYPNPQQLKRFNRLDEILKNGVNLIDRYIYKEYFKGESIIWNPKPNEQYLEPFGTLVLANANPQRHIRVCGVSLKMKTCTKK